MNRSLSGRTDFPTAASISSGDEIVSVCPDSEKLLGISFQFGLECFRSVLKLLDNLPVSRRIVGFFKPTWFFVLNEDVVVD